MKCPHCGKSISPFSKALNRFGKKKTCPHCQGSVRLFVSLRLVALLFIPTVLLALLLKPMFVSLGIGSSLGTGILTGLLILLTMRLKAV